MLGIYVELPVFCKLMPHVSKTDRVLQLVQQMGVVRPKDLARHGLAPVYLRRLCARGLLTQAARGLYTAAAGVSGSASGHVRTGDSGGGEV